MQTNSSVPDVWKKRTKWKAALLQKEVRWLVLMDEAV